MKFHMPVLDFQAEQAAKVEKMRQSILEGLNFSAAEPPTLPGLPRRVFLPPPLCTPRTPGSGPPAQGQGGALQVSVSTTVGTDLP